jgi:hypothetical protein
MARKEKKFHYLYRIVNIKNDKYYIGMHSTDNLDDGYMGGGKRITNSVRKHGKDAHTKEILEYFNDRESLREKEIEIVNENLLNDPMCMNLMRGGDGGYISVENQRARSIGGGKAFAKKLKEDENLRIKHSKQCSMNLIKAHREGKFNYATFNGKKHTEEAKRSTGIKNSINQMGEKNSQFGTRWINNGELNKKVKSIELDSYINNGWILGRI